MEPKGTRSTPQAEDSGGAIPPREPLVRRAPQESPDDAFEQLARVRPPEIGDVVLVKLSLPADGVETYAVRLHAKEEGQRTFVRYENAYAAAAQMASMREVNLFFCELDLAPVLLQRYRR